MASLGLNEAKVILKHMKSVSVIDMKNINRRVSQIRVSLAVCRELTVDHNTLLEVLYVFEDKA